MENPLMAKAYKRYDDRKNQRTKYALAVIAFIIFGLIVQSYLTFYAMNLYFYWSLVIILTVFISFLYVLKKPWSSETLETYIFANLYQAVQQFDLYSNEDKKSEICLKKGLKNIETSIYYLNRFEKQLKDVNSDFVKTELAEPINRLRKNLKARIIPRVNNPPEITRMISILRGLADLFSQIQKPLSIASINDKNKIIEEFDVIETKKQPKQYSLFLSKRPVRFVLSNIVGFVFISTLALIQALATNTNFWDFLGSTTNFLTFLGLVVALGLGIFEVTKKA